MRMLDESVVGDNEVDSLGHMNARFYLVRVQRAAKSALSACGIRLDDPEEPGALFERADTYCRFYREQLVGALLQVRGGILDAAHDGVRVAVNITNPVQAELAASFIIRYVLLDRATRSMLSWPPELRARCEAAAAGLAVESEARPPELKTLRTDLTLEQVENRIRRPNSSLMGGSFERAIQANECDEDGYLRFGVDLVSGVPRVAQLQADRGEQPPVFRTGNGRRFGWALLETRGIVLSRPRAGEVLRVLAADIGMRRKTCWARRWLFNLSANRLVGMEDTVGIGLDLDARRSVEIPPDIRRELEHGLAPELA